MPEANRQEDLHGSALSSRLDQSPKEIGPKHLVDEASCFALPQQFSWDHPFTEHHLVDGPAAT